MINLLLKPNKPTVLYTESPKLAAIITQDIIQQQNYRYSSEIDEKTIINCFNYKEAKEIATKIKEDTIIVCTFDLSVWDELNPNLEKINLDNLSDEDKIVLMSNLVFSSKRLRKAFSSSFWINLLRILSNSFFELHFLDKVISLYFNDTKEKISIGRSFFNALIDYFEDNYSMDNILDIYPPSEDTGRFLYFLTSSDSHNNPYKIFQEVDMLERLHYKYKLLAEFSTKQIENLVISKELPTIQKIIGVFNQYLGNLVYITSLRSFPDFNDQSIIYNLSLSDHRSLYPFSLVFLLLDKKVLVLRINDQYFLFEIKSYKYGNIENIKAVFRRFGIDFSYLDIIYYSSSEIYSEFIKLVIELLNTNPSLAYNVIGMPLLALDYEYYNNVGFVCMVVDRLDLAEKNFKQYLSSVPNDFLVNYNLATTYWLTKRYTEALQIISRLLNLFNTSRIFSVIIPIYPFRKKTILYDIESINLLKISYANLLFLNGKREEALNILKKLLQDGITINISLKTYLEESLRYINENSNPEGN